MVTYLLLITFKKCKDFSIKILNIIVLSSGKYFIRGVKEISSAQISPKSRCYKNL